MKRTPPRHCAIYCGAVRHRRFDAVRHTFTARLYFAYLDLAELEQAFAGRVWWSATRPAPMWFRRADHFGPPDVPLADAVRTAVAAATGCRPNGPIRVLTNLRAFGYVFNPVSLYYCFDADGALAAVLAEITNTPWGERHHYVLSSRDGERARARFAKRFHVSPFQPMEQDYEWALTRPGERLAVHMRSRADGATAFDATLSLQRRPWTTVNLVAAALRHPWMTAKVILTIHWQALRLWCKRAPFHVHPAKRGAV